ncbi:MAG: helix-turn-helix domain-containing protein [Fastidiosipilaceae bacterium]|mgnify:CR=1 FL=1|jgi:transcriptional regulator with XRE-family HTH domain|nr:helix-turn-helix transcriptional regulator [Clostridiaceae bacterium]
MNRLKLLRETKRVMQKDLAEYLDVSPSALSNWEAGRTQISTEYLIKLCEYFGVTADYLLGLDTELKNLHELHTHRTNENNAEFNQYDIDMVRDLEAISALYDSGHLTDEEFKVAKRKILNLQ